MDIAIRKAEPSDAEAIWKCYTAPQAVRNTLRTLLKRYGLLTDPLRDSDIAWAEEATG